MVCHVSPSLCTAAAKGDTETVEKHLHAQCCNPFATQYFINPDCDSHSQSAIVGLTRRKRTVFVAPKNGDEANAVKPATPLQVALYYRQEGVLFQLLNHYLKIANGNVARCYDETAEAIATANGYTHLMDFFQYYDNYNSGRETFATCWTEAMRHICDLTSKVVKYRKQIAELMSEKECTVRGRDQADTQAFTTMLDQKDNLIQRLQYSLREKDDQLAQTQTQFLVLKEQYEKITGGGALDAIMGMRWDVCVGNEGVGVEITQVSGMESQKHIEVEPAADEIPDIDYISQCMQHHLGLSRQLDFLQDYVLQCKEKDGTLRKHTASLVGHVEANCAWNINNSQPISLPTACSLIVDEQELQLFEGSDGAQTIGEICHALERVGSAQSNDDSGAGLQKVAAAQLSKATQMKELLESNGIAHEDCVNVLWHVMQQLQKVFLSPDVHSLLAEAEEQCVAAVARIQQCIAEKTRCEEMGSVLAVEKELHRQMSLQRQLLDVIRDKLEIVHSKSEEAEAISGFERVCQSALAEIQQIMTDRESLRQRCAEDAEAITQAVAKRAPEMQEMQGKAAAASQALRELLAENDASQDAQWRAVAVGFAELARLQKARSDAVRAHLELIMGLKRQERENDAFQSAATQLAAKLAEVGRKCQASLDVSRLIAEVLVDCTQEVQASVSGWQGQLLDLRLRLHREFYERFTDWYLTQGEYTHKKRLLLLDVRRKISETQNLKRLAIQRLDSAAEQHGEILVKLEQQRSDLEETQLPRLEETLRAALALFGPTQRFLEANGIPFTHPEVELQKWNEHREMEIHMREISKYQELLIHSQKSLLECNSSIPLTERLHILENQQRIQTQHIQLETLVRERDAAKAKASSLQEENRRLKEALQRQFVMIPMDFLDPITLEIIADPVIAADDHTYERESIERWLAKKQTSPKTNEPLKDLALRPNHTLRAAIEEWKQKQTEALALSQQTDAPAAEPTAPATPLRTPPASPGKLPPTSPLQL